MLHHQVNIDYKKEIKFIDNFIYIATVDDYDTNLLSVTISPGLRNTTARLSITDDDMLESEESLNISLVIPGDVISKRVYPGNLTSAIVRINDNDGKYSYIIYAI